MPQISMALGLPVLVGAAFMRDADERRPEERRTLFISGALLTAVFEAIIVLGLLAIRSTSAATVV